MISDSNERVQSANKSPSREESDVESTMEENVGKHHMLPSSGADFCYQGYLER